MTLSHLLTPATTSDTALTLTATGTLQRHLVVGNPGFVHLPPSRADVWQMPAFWTSLVYGAVHIRREVFVRREVSSDPSQLGQNLDVSRRQDFVCQGGRSGLQRRPRIDSPGKDAPQPINRPRHIQIMSQFRPSWVRVGCRALPHSVGTTKPTPCMTPNAAMLTPLVSRAAA